MSFIMGKSRTRNAAVHLGFETLDGRELLSVIIYNPPGSAQPETQPYVIDLGNTGKTSETFRLSIIRSGSGNGTLNHTSVTVAAHQTATATFTPTADSSKADDVQIEVLGAGSQTDFLTVAKVTLPVDVKNADTPVGMNDRIPPRTTTTAVVSVSPSLVGSGEALYLEVAGQGNGHGTATINGLSEIQIVSNTTVQLAGVNQTEIATPKTSYAGKLYLAIATGPLDSNPIVESTNGFSVAAIPINFVETFATNFDTTTQLGLVVNVSWSSDSGQKSDLNGVNLIEQYQTISQNGSLSHVGFVGQTAPFLGNITGGHDTHSINKIYINGNGSLKQNQVYTFSDMRSGDGKTYYAVPNSGYEIDYTVTLDTAKSSGTTWVLNTIKTGKHVTANGFTSDAGAGTASNSLIN
jgi:hypothetical protein